MLLLECSPHVYDVVGLPKHGSASTRALDAIAEEYLFPAVKHNACVPHTFNLQQAGKQVRWSAGGGRCTVSALTVSRDTRVHQHMHHMRLRNDLKTRTRATIHPMHAHAHMCKA
jgi:hypothetical protein